VTSELVPVADGDIAQTEQYKALLADCREIQESARRSALDHYWRLGEAIDKAAPREQREEWGASVIPQLEADLAIDRTTLIRSVQLYEQFNQATLGAHGQLTWGKLRLLLPISRELQAQILPRIESGELRTVDDVRREITFLKQDLGMLPPPPARNVRHQLHLAGFDEDIVRKPLQTTWNRLDPFGRTMFVTALIPSLGLDDADRPQALELLRAMRRQVDEVEAHLGEGVAGDDIP